MDSVTINPDTFKLLDQFTLKQIPPLVPGGVHYDEPTKVATFTPPAVLQNGRTYGATITSAITAGFSERDPHRMMHMRDLDEGLV